MTEDSKVAVEPADRLIVSAMLVDMGHEGDGKPQDVRDGDCDDSNLVQAVARSRLAERERCAGIAKSPGFVQARDNEWDAGFNAAKYLIAHAIRTEDRP